MKILQNLALAIVLLTLFVSCQPASSQTKGLSNKDTRNKIMGEIANDSMMSREMIGAMMNCDNGKMMMQENQMMNLGNHSSMMNLLQNNPGMMQNMLSSMMERANGDTTMMSGMLKTMMENKQMMEMMQSRMGNGGRNSMKHMGGMSN